MARVKGVVEVDAGQDREHVGLQERDQQLKRGQRHHHANRQRAERPAENAEATDLRRWFSEVSDIRNDVDVAEEVLASIADTGAKSAVMTDRVIGCPHEEGIDYEGSTCPDCPFWAGRDRWTGKRLQ